MSPVIGNIIAIVIVAAAIVVCGKNCIKMLKNEISGKGCSGCGGSCSCGCSGNKKDKSCCK